MLVRRSMRVVTTGWMKFPILCSLKLGLPSVTSRRGVLLVIAAGLCLAAGKSATGFEGTWEMDRAASEFKGKTVYAKRTIIFTDTPEGLRMSSTGITPGGTARAGQYTARLDGKWYPVRGNIGPDEISLTAVSASVIEFVNKSAGKVLAVGRYELSDHGRILVLITENDTPAGRVVTMRTVFHRIR